MRAQVLPALGIVAVLAGTGGYVLAPSAVTSRVVDVEGRPVAGAVAALTVEGQPTLTEVTGATGTVVLPGAPRLPGRAVTVSAPGYLPATARPGERTVLHRRPALFGRLLDERGDGVDHGVVHVDAAGAEFGTVTDGAGFFHLEGVLPAGFALVRALAGNHDSYATEVVFEADHSLQLFALLPRRMGSLNLVTDPPGMSVTLDGQPLDGCPATPCAPDVSAGHHTLGLSSDLYVPWSSDLTVLEGETLDVSATLQRKTGTLVVTAPPGANATLSIDGRPAGGLSWTGTLPTGSHAIVYTADDRWPATLAANVEWNHSTTVNVASAAVQRGDEAGFQAGLAQYLSSLPGQFSAWVAPLSGGNELGFAPSSSMEAASVIKLPLAIYLERQDQDGKLKMSDQLELEDADFMGGTGTLYGNANSGDKYAYRDLLALLIQQSDNTAWQALDRVLGAGSVDGYAASAGAPDCHQEDDQCTPREAGILVQKLAAGQLLDDAHTKDLVGLLENTAFNDRINYYLGQYPIAHKVGMDGSVINDTGVVYGPRPFVVSMFTNADPAIGVEAIRQVSRMAARLYGD